MHFSKRTNKKIFMHCHASNIHLATKKNQTSCKSTEDIIRERRRLNVESLKRKDSMSNL